ncbi:hypothetical protein CVIRNUC_002754 [Coccomyxa viridis]|uniref:Uncharacterized protein n=1 Tax=Coccomyxa viridis TaxID=1274662 RepID=A0AAV1HZP6_9CHLO|nr:hypothetical protein CVIRNUC_002754 [Coccomyxa viridis]
MSDSDDDVPLSKRAPAVKKETIVKAEPTNGRAEGSAPALKAEKGPNKSSPDGEKASKKSMPKIPKTEDPESSKKGPTEKSSKGSKASAAQKGSVETTGKPKGKAAKDAGKADKAAPVKRERKVYELPGQTKDTPPEVDPLRKFYMSLREQRPDSAIAAKWLLQVGLLPLEEAKVEAAKLKNLRSPVKAPRAAGTPGTKRKRPADEKASPAKNAKAAQNGAKKKQPASKKAKTDESEDDGDSDFSEEAPLVQRKRAAPQKPAAVPAARRPVPKGKKDVAFTDGGMDGEDSSDDDMPLAQRALKVAG